MKKVHASWQQKEVASMLLLDVLGAFDNVSYKRLLYNLQKRQLPLEIIGWIASYLKDYCSKIKLQEGTGPEFSIYIGILQGSLLSLILYLFYNADLLEIKGEEDLITGYINDISIMVSRKVGENNAQLVEIHKKAEEWAQRHTLVFALDKYELLHF
jgi:hypothetical protein